MPRTATGQPPSEKGFRDALAALRDGNPTQVHFDLLCTRIKSRLSPADVATFKNAPRIYPTIAQADSYNTKHLWDLMKPALIVACTSTGPGGNVASRDAGNLEKQLIVCFGAKVMLTEDFCSEKGLMYGAIGTVVDLSWTKESVAGIAASDLRKVPPTVLMVHFDSYTGPPVGELTRDPRPSLAMHIAQHFSADEQARLDLKKIIPIHRCRRDFIYRGKPCTRTQFPLTTAYAISVPKSQGCKLDKAVIDISAKDFTPELAYDAISCVKSLKGIMFDGPFELQDITTKPNAGTTS
ncbi:uncharacterized protein CPUR_00828 [Claviceps purpurea 20.1]|uniref:Uncharacterized protein n=1 Tax=Claviceps purpurea (strain 20.1) TaxID=1111077 RepID=M1W9U6_CLAP2|nr:uncharacterized protein CPUR_00828 [Claviceps purpurea 20.1]